MEHKKKPIEPRPPYETFRVRKAVDAEKEWRDMPVQERQNLEDAYAKKRDQFQAQLKEWRLQNPTSTFKDAKARLRIECMFVSCGARPACLSHNADFLTETEIQQLCDELKLASFTSQTRRKKRSICNHT